jgi:hypothetical protein
MFQISVIKKGKITHGANQWSGQPFISLADAQSYINYVESKPSCPWGRPAGWFKLVRENTIEFMGEKTILPAEILETRIIDEMGSIRTEVRLAATYTIEIIDLDFDVKEIARKKKAMIKTVRALALEQFEEKYTVFDVAVLDIKENLNIRNAEASTTAYTNMKNFVLPINQAKNTCIDAIKACATMAELRAITYNDQPVF